MVNGPTVLWIPVITILGANSLAMHVELAVTKVGLSGLHAIEALLEVTDECLDNECQTNVTTRS
jgi:hypothetical protein